MPYKIHLSIIILLLFQISCFAQSNILLQGNLVTSNVIHQVPFTNTKNEIVLSVNLQGNSSNFILDTGAPLSITRELQLKYKFPLLKKVPLLDASNNPDTVLIVLIDSLRFGKVLIIGIPALVLNLKDSPLKCTNIDGILGSNALRFFVLKFDLESKFVTIATNKNQVLSNNQVPTAAFYTDHQYNAFIKVHLDSNLIDTAHFDSGMGGFYDMNNNKIEQLVSALQPSKSILKGYGSSGQGILGKGNNQIVYSLNSSIKIGSNALKNVTINTTPAKSRLGRELLNQGILIIDYINAQFYFQSNSKNSLKTSSNFGFEILHQNGKVVVSLLWNNTPACKSGLQVGSEIISVNKIKFNKLDYCSIENAITREFSKKKVNIEFRSNDKVIAQSFYSIN